jgi:hypothetical protein
MKRFLILLMVCGSAHAEFWDGNMMHSRFNGSTVEQGLALGYVIGVTDATQNALHCAPENVTAGQVRDMVKNYLENTPAVRHFSADSLVVRVLKASWPCAKPSGRGV